MRHRTFVVTAIAATMMLGACKKDPPPPVEPTGPTAEELAEMERQRIQDSIDAARRAEEARLAEQRRAEEARMRAIADATNTLLERVHFDYDLAEIRPDAERVLRAKLGVLRASPAVRIRIEGHCDERGSNEYNQALGNRRAQAIIDFFTNFGLDASRFTLVSFGEENPLVNRSDEDAWAMNRRGEFIITAGRDQINPGGGTP
jgi:peptidoglycan-associated lipoprotein